VAYLALRDRTPVYDPAGKRTGVVEHVAQFGAIFDGLIIHTEPLPGRHLMRMPSRSPRPGSAGSCWASLETSFTIHDRVRPDEAVS
jgi:hypothetical protein